MVTADTKASGSFAKLSKFSPRVSPKSERTKTLIQQNELSNKSKTSIPSPLQAEHRLQSPTMLRVTSLVQWLPKLAFKSRKAADLVPKNEDGSRVSTRRPSESSQSSLSSANSMQLAANDVSPSGDVQRYPLDVEKQLYELSYKKLCQPKRALGQQVAVSNLMLWYMAISTQSNSSSEYGGSPCVSQSEQTLSSICAQARLQAKTSSKEGVMSLSWMLSKYMDSLKKRKRASNMNPREGMVAASAAQKPTKLQRRRSISAPASEKLALVESPLADDSGQLVSPPLPAVESGLDSESVNFILEKEKADQAKLKSKKKARRKANQHRRCKSFEDDKLSPGSVTECSVLDDDVRKEAKKSSSKKPRSKLKSSKKDYASFENSLSEDVSSFLLDERRANVPPFHQTDDTMQSFSLLDSVTNSMDNGGSARYIEGSYGDSSISYGFDNQCRVYNSVPLSPMQDVIYANDASYDTHSLHSHHSVASAPPALYASSIVSESVPEQTLYSRDRDSIGGYNGHYSSESFVTSVPFDDRQFLETLYSFSFPLNQSSLANSRNNIKSTR